MSEAWEAILARSESPIETMLAEGIRRDLGWPAHAGSIHEVPVTALGWHSALVFSQQPIGRYRADFAIGVMGRGWRWPKLFVVECDGREWHSSPEAQQRDAARDEFIGDLGMIVLRLKGYEIWHKEAWRWLPDRMGIAPDDWKLRGSYEGADEFYAALRAERKL